MYVFVLYPADWVNMFIVYEAHWLLFGTMMISLVLSGSVSFTYWEEIEKDDLQSTTVFSLPKSSEYLCFVLMKTWKKNKFV